MIKIELAWIDNHQQAKIVPITTKETKAIEILQQWQKDINWQKEFTEKNLSIWSKKITKETLCKENDRIEWLKPLLIDPKASRILRKNKQQKSKP